MEKVCQKLTRDNRRPYQLSYADREMAEQSSLRAANPCAEAFVDCVHSLDFDPLAAGNFRTERHQFRAVIAAFRHMRMAPE
ncbi:hypothetical protein FY140_24725 (plasmid) [Agrobacterium tumefaciens]|uniref:hypothetical protein n=1 Tax=Agrobacterium tumefaciens TaxID=358 RepID=UPI0021D1CD18|nr:hypothetical protein [Agrobacterium tumefaciens]UXT23997.1 hypothetical protein FY140_24725 [Agrobacterium tumefaciens]